MIVNSYDCRYCYSQAPLPRPIDRSRRRAAALIISTDSFAVEPPLSLQYRRRGYVEHGIHWTKPESLNRLYGCFRIIIPN